MKFNRVIVLPLLTILTIFKSFTQSTYNFKGKVKSVETTYFTIKIPSDTITVIHNGLFDLDNFKDMLETGTTYFNLLGLPVRIEQFDSNILTTFKYDSNWRLIKQKKENILVKESEIKEYTYDNKNRLKDCIQINENFKRQSLDIFADAYEYNLNDSISQHTHIWQSYDSNSPHKKLYNQIIDTFTYDYKIEKNKIKEKNEFFNGKFHTKTIYSYSDKDSLTEINMYQNTGEIDYRILYNERGKIESRTYFDAGYIRTEFELHSNIELPQTIIRNNVKIDDVGNWTYRVIYSNKKISKVIMRSITYY
jgi:hypothetical protein